MKPQSSNTRSPSLSSHQEGQSSVMSSPCPSDRGLVGKKLVLKGVLGKVVALVGLLLGGFAAGLLGLGLLYVVGVSSGPAVVGK